MLGLYLFIPAAVVSTAAAYFSLGRLGVALAKRRASWTEPLMAGFHLSCLLAAAFCATAVPFLVFMAFPIYIENISVEKVVAGIFVLNLLVGAYFQAKGHAAIRAAGEAYAEALRPERRPVLLSRFRASLAGIAVFLMGGAVAAGGAVVIQNQRVDYWRTTALSIRVLLILEALENLRTENVGGTIRILEERLDFDAKTLEERVGKGGEDATQQARLVLGRVGGYRDRQRAREEAEEKKNRQ